MVSIMFKHPLRIPLNIGKNFWVVEEPLTPGPKGPCPYIKLFFLVFIRDRYCLFFELWRMDLIFKLHYKILAGVAIDEICSPQWPLSVPNPNIR